MILFSISLIFLLLHIIFNKSAKANNILVILSFLFVCSVYVILAANSYHSINFLPKKNLELYFHTGNFYNWLMTSFFNFKLNLNVDTEFVNYLQNLSPEYLSNQYLLPMEVKMFYDTSIYNNNIYLYFGITPILLFYIPFYLITHFFISDQIVFLFLSVFIAILQLLIFKKVLLHLIQINILKENINKYFNAPLIIILSLCNGIPLTYIAITVHSITILTSIFCSLVALYIFLLLSNNKYKNLKIFLMGLFLAFAIGARPISVILTIFIFIAILIIDSKKYIYNSSKFQNFQSSNLIKNYLCFFMPLIIYGIILAAYNYLRFDSIFNFGFKYQFSPNYTLNISKNFYFFIEHLICNVFYPPNFITINPYVIFNNASINNFEPLVGAFIIVPIIISLIKLLKFNFFKKNKRIFLFIVIITITSFIYLCIDSYMGSNARFVAEYLSLLLVPSLVLFYNLIEIVNNDILKNIIKFLFLCFIIFSLYVNMNLINCIILMSKNGLI